MRSVGVVLAAGLLRVIEVRIVPEGWRELSGLAEKLTVFEVSHLASGELECINPHSVDGAFVVLALFGAHEEPSFRDGRKGRLGDDFARGWIRDGRHCSRISVASLRIGGCKSSTSLVKKEKLQRCKAEPGDPNHGGSMNKINFTVKP